MFRRQGSDRSRQVRRLGVALVFMLLSLIQYGAAGISAQSTPEATPLSQAVVDDVTIALLSWSSPSNGGGTFEAKIAMTNRSGDHVAIDPSVVLVIESTKGNLERIQLMVTPAPERPIEDGQQVEFILRGQLKAGEKPERLIVGLIEPHRAGGRVEFPFNGDGASAFGGSEIMGGDVVGGIPISGGDATTPAGATPADDHACGG
jgi:hypothetical protein